MSLYKYNILCINISAGSPSWSSHPARSQYPRVAFVGGSPTPTRRPDHLSVQPTDAQQVGGNAHDLRVLFYSGEPPEPGLAQTANRVHPPKDLLDPLPNPLPKGIAHRPSRAAIQARGGAPGHLGDVGPNAPRTQAPNGVTGVIVHIHP